MIRLAILLVVLTSLTAASGVEPPYPPSPVIATLQWAPAETIVRQAKGGDNWPMTWADDGHLYTAYGDANGFEPFLPQKLSMGFARVEGPADHFTGVNIRSETGERIGEGPRGEKASGLLMVRGVLYLWVRNAGNSRLGWSKDHSRTWEWADWKFTTSFGCPTFLNFGQNYAGARDAFVYVYSQDADSAYVPAERMVLARAPADRLTERAAYEFFAGLDPGGKPNWTEDVAARRGVFEHQPGRCYRSGVTYNAGLKRYLWSQILPGKNRTFRGDQRRDDPRFEGGFGVYDAPAPWGPWTTVFYTEKWDAGPGETSSFPTKWMSQDGRTVHLVFSGDDHFSVRKATCVLKAAAGR